MEAPVEVFVAFDMADSKVVEMEATTGVTAEGLEGLVYRYVMEDGTEHYSLSLVGLREVVRALNAGKKKPTVFIEDVKVKVEGGFVIALAIAVAGEGLRWFGAASAPLRDPFAVPKAVSRAQRNALRAALPPTVVHAYTTKFIKEGKVTTVTKPALPTPSSASETEQREPITPTIVSNGTADLSLPEDEREAWRMIYRAARTLWGDDFVKSLRETVQERFGAERFGQLSAAQREELFNWLLQQRGE